MSFTNGDIVGIVALVIFEVWFLITIATTSYRLGFHKGKKNGVEGTQVKFDEELYHKGFRDGLAQGMLGGENDSVCCVASVSGADIEKCREKSKEI